MKIYHCFIPNKKNKFHPVALRTTGLIIFFAIFFAVPLLYNITTARQFRILGYATNINIDDLNNLSNQERLKTGLTALSLNPTLNTAALAKAKHMIANNYWAHIAPDGTTPWSFINNVGYTYISAGENLAMNFNTSSGVVAGWMGSPTHRDNILNTSYKDAGYAVINGTLLGSETTLVVAMYGLRSEVPTNTDLQYTESQPQIAAITNTQPVKTESARPNNIGIVEQIASIQPIRIYNSFNWGQKISILLASTLILLFVMKHTLIWREQKRGFKHIWLRSHPLGQIAILTIIIIATILSGIGIIL